MYSVSVRVIVRFSEPGGPIWEEMIAEKGNPLNE